MKNTCVYIPDKLFGELLEITGNNRQLTKQLWGLSQIPTARQILGLGNDFSAKQFLEKLSGKEKLDKWMDRASIVKFINMQEDTIQSTFDNFYQANMKIADIEKKHNDVVPIITHKGKKFGVNIVEKTSKSRTQRFRQEQLKILNDKLLKYIEQLGFAARQVDNLETPGVFSPLDADTNANGLKEVIMISKGEIGQQSLPEEIAHLLVEGFQNNQFMQRLMQNITYSTIEQILDDEFDAYYEEYDGDETLLKKEAIGKLVAQHLVDRSGIGDDIRFISDKVLDRMRQNINRGSESEVDQMIREFNENIQWFIDSTIDANQIEMFDQKAVSEQKSQLKRLAIRLNTTQDMAEKDYNIMAKRITLKSRKQDKQSSKDVVEFNKMNLALEKKQYAIGCLNYIKYVLQDCNKVLDDIQKLKQKYIDGGSNDLKSLKYMSRVLNEADTVLHAYDESVRQLSTISKDDDVSNEADEEMIGDIRQFAADTKNVLDNIRKTYKEMNINGMARLYATYWGGDKTITLSDGTKKTMTLENVLMQNVGDMNTFTRFVNSMEDAPDPLLQMVDMLYKDAVNMRDQDIFRLQQMLQTYLEEYVRDTGSRDMLFLFELDENGKPTGMLKSDIDFRRFHKEKNEYINKLKQQGVEKHKLTALIKKWEQERTEYIVVSPEGSNIKRVEKVPLRSMYKSNQLDQLTAPQRKLYDRIIALKKGIDMLLPRSKAHLYRAPQKKIQIKDQLIKGRNIKSVLKRIKDMFVSDASDDVDYGEDEQIEQYVKGKHVTLDFSGKEVKKVPVFYTTWLDDMSTLDTNLIDTMLSYGAMAYNYHTMSDISDFMEQTNSLMQDRKIVQTSGVRRLIERFKPTKDIVIQNDYVIDGRYSESAKKLRNYIDQNVYGIRKKNETINIGGSKLHIGKIGDALMGYNSLVGLGYNIFSGTTNLTMGFTQTMMNAVAGSIVKGKSLFEVKDLIHANKKYFIDLPKNIMDQYQDAKKSKLTLLMQYFDCLEEYYQRLDDNNYYGGIFKKMIGKHNPLILNSMGEHYLHAVSMIAILSHIKVRSALKDKDGNIMTDENGNIKYGELQPMYDAIDVIEKKINGIDGKMDIASLNFEHLVKEDGTRFSADDMLQLKLQIQQANHRMHGAFNDADRGDINRFVLGRMAMQFRQWMPAFYMNRFRRQRLNVVTGEMEEGFYNTYYKFIFGILKDWIHLKKSIGIRYSRLSDTQKVNLWKGLMESSLAIILGILFNSKRGVPDKDDPALVNLLKYNAYRLKMELIAASPMSIGFLDNVQTLIKSPIPAMENIDRLINLVDITQAFETMQSGRYAGWNRYLRNLYFATPTVRNIGRFVDLATNSDITMFNPYIKAS